MLRTGLRVMVTSIVAFVAAFGVSVASAQTATAATSPAGDLKVTAEPSAPSRCLTTVPGAPTLPEYPMRARRLGLAATVDVQLRFAGPDRAPRMTVMGCSADAEDFVESLRKHAQNLRVPCMSQGAPEAAMLVQFVFKPDDRPVLQGLPTDA